MRHHSSNDRRIFVILRIILLTRCSYIFVSLAVERTAFDSFVSLCNLVRHFFETFEFLHRELWLVVTRLQDFVRIRIFSKIIEILEPGRKLFRLLNFVKTNTLDVWILLYYIRFNNYEIILNLAETYEIPDINLNRIQTKPSSNYDTKQ